MPASFERFSINALIATSAELADFGDPNEMMAKAMNGADGSRYVIQTLVLPFVGGGPTRRSWPSPR